MSKKITKRFFEEPRMQIIKILIEEIEPWESTTKVTTDEFLHLVDRLARLFPTKTDKQTEV